jgi:hypothetical protein
MTMKKLDKTELFVLATLNMISKKSVEGFEYKILWSSTSSKRDQGIAIANYLTEQTFRFCHQKHWWSKMQTEVRLIIHL